MTSVLSTSDIITTVAGSGSSSAGYSGDGGAATSAQLNGPFGVATDSSGNVYVADCVNNRIRKVTISTGIIATIAGSGGTDSFGGDKSDATLALLNNPQGVTVDATGIASLLLYISALSKAYFLGNIYIADSSNNRIRKVSNGIISTIAGNGTGGYFGDGVEATSAYLKTPTGVSLDASGRTIKYLIF